MEGRSTSESSVVSQIGGGASLASALGRDRQRHVARQVPSRRRARPRRHGRRVPRHEQWTERLRLREAGRAEEGASELRRPSGLHRDARRGGPHQRAPEPPQRGADDRSGGRGRVILHGDGVPRRAVVSSREESRREARDAASPRGGAHRRPRHARGAPLRPRAHRLRRNAARHRASGRHPAEPLRDVRRAGQSRRFRDRQSVGQHGRNATGHREGKDSLHVARASERPRCRPPQRHLLGRDHALGGGHATALLGWHRGAAGGAAVGEWLLRAFAARHRRLRPRGHRPDLLPRARLRARGSISKRGRDAERPRRLPRATDDLGATRAGSPRGRALRGRADRNAVGDRRGRSAFARAPGPELTRCPARESRQHERPAVHAGHGPAAAFARHGDRPAAVGRSAEASTLAHGRPRRGRLRCDRGSPRSSFRIAARARAAVPPTNRRPSSSSTRRSSWKRGAAHDRSLRRPAPSRRWRRFRRGRRHRPRA